MSDKEEPSASKRPHESDDKTAEDEESSDGWIGPLPTDAAPVKKRKGIYTFSFNFIQSIHSIHSQLPFALSSVLEYEKLYLENLPDAECYEKSYMHRDVITHIVVTKTDFTVTASIDGHLKFWKKMEDGIEFVKHFRSHLCMLIRMRLDLNELHSLIH